MITRITQVKAFRIFRDFIWPSSGLPEFDRYNLVYGWNGTGKTTLSRLFSSLQTRTPLPVGEGHFMVDGVDVGTQRLDTAALPPVRVFNRDTIERSVVAGAAPTVPAIYILGEKSTEKKAELDERVLELEQSNKELELARARLASAEKAFGDLCTGRAREVRTLLTTQGNGPYNNYDARDFKASIAKLRSVTAQRAPLTPQERERARQTHATPAKGKLPLLVTEYPSIPTIANQVHKLLSLDLKEVSKVGGLDDPEIADWVHQGLSLHRGDHESDTCRFCAQGIPIERLTLLEAHFSGVVEQHLHDIDGCTEDVIEMIAEIEAVNVADGPEIYPHLLADWRTAHAKLKSANRATKDYLKQLEVALRAKRKQPFQKQKLPPASGSLSEGQPVTGGEVVLQMGALLLTSLVNLSGKPALEDLNGVIARHNQYSANYVSEVAASRRALEEEILREAMEEFTTRERDAAGHAEEVRGREGEVTVLQEMIARLEGEIRDARRPAERMTTDLSLYLGRKELEFSWSGNGYEVRRHGEPATHLSEGERTAVAFVYFLQSLTDQDFDLVNGVIVIDDPVSSLDSNALYNAFAFMKNRIPGRDVFRGQLFVLTHSFAFFRAAKNWFVSLDKGEGNRPIPKANQRARYYSLQQVDVSGKRSAQLTRMDDLLFQFESEYHYLFGLVLSAATGGPGDLTSWYNMPNVGRRLLEAVLSFKAPGHVGELRQQLATIADFEQSRKDRILRFCHVHSHGSYIGELDADISVLSETPEVMKEILALVEHLDKGHFDSMKALVQAAIALGT